MNAQRDIFEVVETPQPGHHPAAFPELCTALYERELAVLAQQDVASAKGLQRRLKSLSYYIQKAARDMLASDSPCELDVQNASWQAAQKRQLKSTATRAQKLHQWLQSGNVPLGLSVPVLNLDPHLQQVRLDSIDRIDPVQQRVHCNASGWFDFNGESCEADGTHLVLAKPEKQLMQAAVSGHQWSHKGRIDPRTLSLRELLLAAAIDWNRLAG
ncbi:hypothetical protein CWI80_01290 [Pseudidiomarina sediminum]|uniref:Uncharacterized protein n=1 Tax=Pseudidiomarina sediminum TaxID=431675 RepID=A0A432Z812_9GAMM|nr:hypothetical protein [Pseudidiomarina sediminum]MBY6063178.1 hypothetical protein [Pseudidiomarina sediminum]RUO74025.1 hypothetical protein CWI80_01290 [Pseudidiomarina sediminum]